MHLLFVQINQVIGSQLATKDFPVKWDDVSFKVVTVISFLIREVADIPIILLDNNNKRQKWKKWHKLFLPEDLGHHSPLWPPMNQAPPGEKSEDAVT